MQVARAPSEFAEGTEIDGGLDALAIVFILRVRWADSFLAVEVQVGRLPESWLVRN
jgi:hypothetical protein